MSHSVPAPASSGAAGSSGLIHRLGFPSAGMVVGFIAVTVFLVGDGIEIVWISDYLHTSRGIPLDLAGQAVAWYGIVVAISAFLASALSKSWGPRTVMLIGLLDFVVFDLLFILVGLPGDSWALLVFVYAMRGVGYPFFAYGFLTWVLSISPAENQGKMNGWFWFAYSTGTQIIGSALAAFLLDGGRVSHVGVLWVGLVLTVLGGAVGLWMMRHEPQPRSQQPIGHALGTSVSVMWRYPKVTLGVIVKIINLAAPFGLNVMLVTYLSGEFGMSGSAAINMFVVYGVFAVIGNVFWGYMGERLGWHFCTQWIAIPGCAAALLYLYYVPQLVGNNFPVVALGMVLLGLTISAFVPMVPLTIAFAHGEAASVMAMQNFASGAASFIGPLLVNALFSAFGFGGSFWVLAGLYGLAFVLARFMKLPGGAKTIAHLPPELAEKYTENADPVADEPEVLPAAAR